MSTPLFTIKFRFRERYDLVFTAISAGKPGAEKWAGEIVMGKAEFEALKNTISGVSEDIKIELIQEGEGL